MEDVAQMLSLWAERHREVVCVELGGSRAKGTHLPHSDYDFGVSLETTPTVNLVERLVQDIHLPRIRVQELSLANRHFRMVAAQFKTAEGIEMTLAFSNILEFEHSFNEGGNYAIIDERFEFLKSSRIVYDPHGRLAALKSLAYPGWVRKRVLDDCIAFASWNLDKYRKALSKNALFAAELGKTECLWLLIKAVATLNHINVGHRYEYERTKEQIVSLKDSLYPVDFFASIERCAQGHSPDEVQRLLDETVALVRRVT